MAKIRFIKPVALLALFSFAGTAAAEDKAPAKDSPSEKAPQQPAKKEAKKAAASKKEHKAPKKHEDSDDGESE